MNEASQYLIELARRLAQPYIALPEIRAIILTGSASEGVSDFYSDLDVILYYETLPSEESLAKAAQTNGGSRRVQLAPRQDDVAAIEHYFINGVECQFAHTTVAGWEAEMASVLEQHDVASPTQKALGGMAEAIPLYGEPLLRQWQATLDAYPESLALAMVQHHMAFFPIWGLVDRMETRDATIWYTQMLVENAHALIGALAGLNHLYFSNFQFKRTERFIAKMSIAPPSFAARLEALFHADRATAAADLEALVGEVIALVEAHMPQVDTTRARRRLGWHPQMWTPVSHIGS
ncbi:MAG: hypothetical protein ABI700_15790 [Chloroflexota bacterium]